jgi:hypothetical protein
MHPQENIFPFPFKFFKYYSEEETGMTGMLEWTPTAGSNL